MTVRAKASLGVPLGLLFMALVAALDWLLLSRLFGHDIPNQQISFVSFLLGLLALASLPVLAVLAYYTLNCATLRYRLDRNGIIIHQAGMEQIIPINEVRQILSSDQIEGAITHRRGLRWPGWERGVGRISGIGVVHFFATRPWPDQLLVLTSGPAFAVSPRTPEQFLQAFAARRELGPNRRFEAGTRRARWLTWPLWTDQTAWALIGAALAINLALFAYLCIRFPGLDLVLPLHFGSAGQVDRFGGKAELFALPVIGLIILGTNLVAGLLLYRWERAAAYLLWGSAAVAQLMFWLATLGLLP
ncbi:MAG: DUF1648 domain-containing protein [Anaerolineae bacterium]|nr:DUF1648 domain-containing protein [Anaerolineae bacterium]